MLDINQIHKTFNAGTVNEKKALNGLDLHLQEGDFVTVIGGNGAGKSTMLNAIAGTWLVDEGSIVIDGIDVTRLSEHKRAKYLGRVFQDPMTGTAASMQMRKIWLWQPEEEKAGHSASGLPQRREKSTDSSLRFWSLVWKTD